MGFMGIGGDSGGAGGGGSAMGGVAAANPYAALIMAILGGANEATTGAETQTRGALQKAAMYKAHAYDKTLDPELVPIHQKDVLGAAMQGGASGYDMSNQMAQNQNRASFQAQSPQSGSGSSADSSGSGMSAAKANVALSPYRSTMDNYDRDPLQDPALSTNPKYGTAYSLLKSRSF